MANRSIVQGEIANIMPHKDWCSIRLKDPQYVPKDEYFRLPISHPNYNALFSLALVAAVNRYKIYIITEKDIINTEYAEIRYMENVW